MESAALAWQPQSAKVRHPARQWRPGKFTIAIRPLRLPAFRPRVSAGGVFTLVYADLAADLVERQRAQGADAAHVAARVTLSREVVDFLQTDVPAVAASLVHFVGAVAMLCVLNAWVGALAVLALLPIGLFTLW